MLVRFLRGGQRHQPSHWHSPSLLTDLAARIQACCDLDTGSVVDSFRNVWIVSLLAAVGSAVVVPSLTVTVSQLLNCVLFAAIRYFGCRRVGRAIRSHQGHVACGRPQGFIDDILCLADQ